MGNGGMFLQCQMRIAIVQKQIFLNQIRFRKTRLDITKLKRHQLLTVVSFSVASVMNRFIDWLFDCFRDTHHGFQDFILNVNRI